MSDSEREDIGSGCVLDSDGSSEHQEWSPPRPKTSKKPTGAAMYRTKFNSAWVSHYRVLFEVERVCIWPLAHSSLSSVRAPLFPWGD